MHPSDEEIASAAEGTASPFSTLEIRAHAGWCNRCGEVAEDFAQFCRPAAVAQADVDFGVGIGFGGG